MTLIIIALVIGLIISLIVMLSHKGQLKSVRFEHSAANYVKAGSVNVPVKREIYLYKKVEKRAKPKDENK